MRVIIILSGNFQLKMHDTDEDFDTPEVYMGRYKVTILDLRDRSELSPTVVFEPLRSLILDEIQEIRKIQKEKCLLISAVYLNTLWDRTLQLQMKGPNPTNLDCLLVARGAYIRNKAMVNCFVELQKQVANSACHESELDKFIASALLLDAYPPGMHRKKFLYL